MRDTHKVVMTPQKFPSSKTLSWHLWPVIAKLNECSQLNKALTTILLVFGKAVWTFGLEQVRVTNTMNRRTRTAVQSHLLCDVGEILNVFLI